MTRAWIMAALFSSVVGLAPAGADDAGAVPAITAPAAGAAATPARRGAKIPYRVVKLLPAQDQAVVYDRTSGEHLLVQLGDDLGDFQVIDVDDEELVLWRDGREIVLTVDPAAPAPAAMLVHRPPQAVSATVVSAAAVPAPSAAGSASEPAATASSSAPSAPETLLDPYAVTTAVTPPPPVTATAVPAPGATIDPYAAPAPATTEPRVVLAPPEQRASLQAADVVDPYAGLDAPVAAAPPAPVAVTAPAEGAAPAPTVESKPVPTVPAAADAARANELRTTVLPVERAQLVAAVASFDRLAKDHGFERTPRGVRLQRVAPDSFAYGLGLRSGDVITAIDGAPLRGLDDAAAAYVGLDTATQLSFDVERAGAHGTLRFALR